jgi:hypothetical protein
MANEVIINIPGIGDVVAENAASESTLRSILAAMEANSRAGGGSGSSSSSSSSSSDSTRATRERESNNIRGQVDSSFKQLASTTGSLISSFSNLGGSVTAAANATSNFTKQIPLVGDTLAIVFKNVASAQRELITSYQQATSVGATFAGSINEFSAYSSAASQTLDQFSSFIATNGKSLALLGDTTEDGAKRFSVLSKSLRETSADLYSLGFSTKDLNNGLIQYTQYQQYYGNVGKRTNADLIAGTKAYMKELDILAKITGESKEKVANDMASLNIDTDFRSYIDSLGANSEKAGKELSSTLETVPESMRKFLKDVITHGVPTSADTQAAWSVFGQTSNEALRYKRALETGTATEADRQRLLNTITTEAAAKNKNSAANLSMWSDTNMQLAKKMAMEGVAFDADRRKKAIDSQDKTLQAQESYNQKYEAFKTKIIEVGNKFTDVLASSGAFGLLTRVFDVLTSIIDKVSVPIFKSFSTVIGSVTKVLETSLGPTFRMFDSWLGELPTIMTAVFNTVFGPDMKSAVSGFTSMLKPLTDSISDFNNSLEGLTPEEQIKVVTNKIATGLEHGMEFIQLKWIELQQSLIGSASSLIGPMINTGARIEQFSLVIEEQIDNIRKSMKIYDFQMLGEQIKLGAMGFQLSIDSLVSKWNAVETWVDRVAAGISHFADLMNYLKVLDPRSKYSEADYNKDLAKNTEYRQSLKRDIYERQQFEEERKEHQKAYDDEKSTIKNLTDEKSKDLSKELAENETNRNVRKKHLEELIKNNAETEARWNKALTDYANKLTEDANNIKTNSEERDNARNAIVDEELAKAKSNADAADKYSATQREIQDKAASTKTDVNLPKNENDRAKLVMDMLKEKGWSASQAAGIAANLHRESRFQPGAVDPTGQFKGIGQWDKTRQEKFKELHHGKSIREASLEEQVDFVNWELNNTHKAAGDAIRNAKTAREAAYITEKKYEVTSASLHGGYHKEQLKVADQFESLLTQINKPTAKPTAYGLPIKSTEATAGGKTEEGTLLLAKALNDKYGNLVGQFTAFNDAYHKENSPTSGHTKGLKFDVTLKDPKNSDYMKAKIEELAKVAGVNVKVMDEYKHPSEKATAGHLDVGFASKADAEKYASAMHDAMKPITNTIATPKYTDDKLKGVNDAMDNMSLAYKTNYDKLSNIEGNYLTSKQLNFASINQPTSPSINTDTLSTFANKQPSNTESTKQADQEAARQQDQIRQDNQQAILDATNVQASFNPQVFDQILQSIDSLKQTMSDSVSVHERHLSVAQRQSGNLFA